jgi:hypothetical protein
MVRRLGKNLKIKRAMGAARATAAANKTKTTLTRNHPAANPSDATILTMTDTVISETSEFFYRLHFEREVS